MKRIISELLDRVSPQVVVLAVDNDPISNLFLNLSRRRQIRTVIIQEGSARPDAYIKLKGLEGYAKELLKLCGVQLSYVLHGTSNLYDQYLVAGPASKAVLTKRGVPNHKIVVTGQPKYDSFMRKAVEYRSHAKDNRNLLFAAGFSVIADEANRSFLKELVRSTKHLGLTLTIKLHPRSSVVFNDIEVVLEGVDSSHCQVIKKGDQTIDFLKKAYGLITVASTVVTEALILDREGILVNYLAKKQKLPFKDYDAVYSIDKEEDICRVLEMSMKIKKPFEKKGCCLNKIFIS